MENKRKWPRAKYQVRGVIEVEGESVNVRCTNVCMDGMLILTDRSLPVGTRGRVEIIQEMGEEKLVVFSGFQVKRIEEEDGVQQMGVSLFDIDSDSSINLFNIVRYNSGGSE